MENRKLKVIIAILALISFYSISGEECKGRLEGFKPCYEAINKVNYSGESDMILSSFEMGIYQEVIGNYTKAHNYYLKSESYKKYAEYLLGLNFLEGLGVDKNEDEALNWFIRSSEKGFDKAMFNAASLIISKKLTSRYNQSYEYLVEAKEKGNVNVYYLLAKSYLQGIGVEPSISKSLAIFSQGYLIGDPNCTAQLAYYYLTGKYVEKDEDKGWELMYKAEYLGSEAARNFIKNKRK